HEAILLSFLPQRSRAPRRRLQPLRIGCLKFPARPFNSLLHSGGNYAIQAPPTAVSGCSSGVEHNLAKVGVEGSNPFARSNKSIPQTGISALRFLFRTKPAQ